MPKDMDYVGMIIKRGFFCQEPMINEYVCGKFRANKRLSYLYSRSIIMKRQSKMWLGTNSIMMFSEVSLMTKDSPCKLSF
jgi:hypothetical protein